MKTVPDCLNLSAIGAPNLEDKLFDLMYVEGTGGASSKPYRLNVLAVEELRKYQQLLYPNPANQAFHINTDSKIITVELYNATGVLVKKLGGVSILDVDTADFLTGLYLLTLTDSNNKKSNHKIIISH